MFHQINLRVVDLQPTTINGVTKQRSLYQMWAETVGTGFVSLTNWPLVQVKNDDMIQVFINRQKLDNCNPTTQLQISNGKITGFTVDATNHVCSVPIPVTLPAGTVTSLQGATTEMIGNDPLTIFVTLSGSPLVYTLTNPITL
jgi:hypothetical protein